MKKSFILLSLFFSIVIIACTNIKEKQPYAKKGILDLKEWELSKNGPITLNGEWEFHWKNFITPNIPMEAKNNYINVPGQWHKKNYNKESLTSRGYASYHLRIINNKIINNLAIYTRDIGSSFDLFINGEKFKSNGKTSSNSDSNLAWMQPNIFLFNSKNSVIDITFHITNFHYLYGGILQDIHFGTQIDILEIKDDFLAFEYFLFGCILIIGIYHLSLFIIRQREKSPLYFAIFCLLIATFTTLSGDRYLFHKVFSTNWELMAKILCSSIYLAIPVFALYMHSIFPKNFSKKILYFLNVTSLVFFFLTIVLPARIHFKFLVYYQILIFFGCLYGYYILINASLRKRKDAITFLLGYAFLTTAVINDMLHLNLIINTQYYIPYGFLAFIIIQTIMLSTRLSRTFVEIEDLSDELQDLNLNLEKKVQHRTEELHAAMDQLLVMNETIVEKNKKLESAQENAMMDMDMAAYVQTNFLPKDVPQSNDWEIAYYFKPLSGVSGDFYDFYVKDNKLHGLGLFDVSGHGISSGLVTMIAKSTIFRNFMHNTNKPLDEVFSSANDELKDEVKNVDYHITGVLLKLNENDWVNYANAGHPDILVRSKSIVFPIRNINNDSISGIFLGEPAISTYESKYEEISFKVEKDDFILLYTDCLVENKSKDGEQYGVERLTEAFRNAPQGSAKRVLDYIVDKFYKFIGSESKQTDDLTLIVLKKI